MLTVGADDLHHMIRDHYGKSGYSNPERWQAKLNDEELDALLDDMMDSSFGSTPPRCPYPTNKVESNFLTRLFEVENFPRRQEEEK
jgi:hypothetical protein